MAESDLRDIRLTKLDRLRALGINAFPPERPERTGSCAEVRALAEEREGEGASVVGRVMLRRVMGGIAFLTLRDESGEIQVTLRKGEVALRASNQRSVISDQKITRAILLHAFESGPDAAFFPWLRRELEARGIRVDVPTLPDSGNPDFATWLRMLQDLQPDEHTLVVGRSLGATLGFAALSRGMRMGKFISVCGAARYEPTWGFPGLEKFFADAGELDFAEIRRSAPEISVLLAEDDPLVTPVAHARILAEKLGVQPIAVPGAGHFTGDEYPEVLAACLDPLDQNIPRVNSGDNDQENFVLIHGNKSSPGVKDPLAWLAKQLAPADVWHGDLPQTTNQYPEQRDFLLGQGVHFGENTTVVAHSRGCPLILKLLSEQGIHLRKLVLLAPPAQGRMRVGGPIGDDVKPYCDYVFDFDAIRRNVGEIVIFRDERDHRVLPEDPAFLAEKLGARLISMAAPETHFNCDELPELLAEVKSPLLGEKIATFGSPQEGISYRARPTAVALLEEQGRLAVCRFHRADGQEYFRLPGGGIDPGESADVAVVRELREEIGLETEPVHRLCAARYFDAQYAEKHEAWLLKEVEFFVMKLVSPMAHGGEEDHELVWLDPVEAAVKLRDPHERWAVREFLRTSLDFPQLCDLIDRGDFLAVRGTTFRTQRGEPSIAVRELSFLGKALRPLPDKHAGLQDEEMRFRRRELDLLFNDEARRAVTLFSDLERLVREFFWKHDFREMRIPVLENVASGTAAKPFVTHLNAYDQDVFLRIASGEIPLKKLAVAGFEKTFHLGPVFRNEGVDAGHNPEFNMVEAYWAYRDYGDMMALMEDFFTEVTTKILGGKPVLRDGEELDFRGPFPRMTFHEALEKLGGIKIPAELIQGSTRSGGVQAASEITHPLTGGLMNGQITQGLTPGLLDESKRLAQLEAWARSEAEARKIDVSKKVGYAEVLDELYKKTARPKLRQPTWLTDYPRELINLAKRHPDRPDLIRSAQLVVQGSELVKLYSELTDPLEQAANFSVSDELEARGAEEAITGDRDFVEAMEHGMPPMVGMGMGIETTARMLAGVPDLREVILFPFMRGKNQGSARTVACNGSTEDVGSLPAEDSARFAAVLSEKIEPGRLMNALGHATAGLVGADPEVARAMHFLGYRDQTGDFRSDISHFPFVILQARNSSKHQELMTTARAAGVRVNAFTDTMSGGASGQMSADQMAATSARPAPELDFWGVVLFGPGEKVRELTRKFSLFK